MKREVSLEEISDGRLYTANDLVRADCGDCKGCSSCCRKMGASIVLDPLDIHRIRTGLHVSFEELLAGRMELNIADGTILPNLKMTGAKEACSFLDENGRCSIHPFRPGICRLFPLGRFYENGSFRYFLQTHECRMENRAKIKVRKWIDMPDIKKYEAFVNDWHNLLLLVQREIASAGADEAVVKTLNMFLLQTFYIAPYDKDADFYELFEERRKRAEIYITTCKERTV